MARVPTVRTSADEVRYVPSTPYGSTSPARVYGVCFERCSRQPGVIVASAADAVLITVFPGHDEPDMATLSQVRLSLPFVAGPVHPFCSPDGCGGGRASFVGAFLVSDLVRDRWEDWSRSWAHKSPRTLHQYSDRPSYQTLRTASIKVRSTPASLATPYRLSIRRRGVDNFRCIVVHKH